MEEQNNFVSADNFQSESFQPSKEELDAQANIKAVKEVSGSTNVFLLAILMTVQLGTTVLAGIINNTFFINILALILNLIITLGVWGIYNYSKTNNDSGFRKIRGTIKALLIIMIVVASLGILLALILIVASGVLMDKISESMNDFQGAGELTGAVIIIIAIILLIVLVAALVLGIIYYKQIMHLMSDAMQRAAGKNPPLKSYMFLIVMIIIGAVSQFLSLLSANSLTDSLQNFDLTLPEGFEMLVKQTMWIDYINIMLSIAISVVSVITIFNYKNTVNANLYPRKY